MSNYVYSAALNMICAEALKNDYVLAGTWPDDAVALSNAQAVEFMSAAPEGKIMLAGANGLPAWGDIPPLSPAEQSRQAEQIKRMLIDNAKEVISIWQTELLLGIITDEDKASLTEWMKYIQAVQAVNVQEAPTITWPQKPQ